MKPTKSVLVTKTCPRGSEVQFCGLPRPPGEQDAALHHFPAGLGAPGSRETGTAAAERCPLAAYQCRSNPLPAPRSPRGLDPPPGARPAARPPTPRGHVGAHSSGLPAAPPPSLLAPGKATPTEGRVPATDDDVTFQRHVVRKCQSVLWAVGRRRQSRARSGF